MLSSIYIKNFAIIDEIEIDFHENMLIFKQNIRDFYAKY